jgi:CopG family nickel-responsive transcriptional regulator
MGVLRRIGIALDSDLLKRFDRHIASRGYTNRSEAFRDLIRDKLVAQQIASPNATVVGSVTLIYDHHAYGVTEKLTELQHAHHNLGYQPVTRIWIMIHVLKCSLCMASRCRWKSSRVA